MARSSKQQVTVEHWPMCATRPYFGPLLWTAEMEPEAC
jgi:hypothetical protein